MICVRFWLCLNMKAMAFSVWIFINLVCFGMCGYIYLIWSQYWMYLERQKMSTEIAPSKTNRIHSNTITYESLADSYNNGDSVQPDNIELPFESLSFELNTSTTRKLVRRAVVRDFLEAQKVSSLALGDVRSSVTRNSGKPRFHNLQKELIEFDTNQYDCDSANMADCVEKMSEFKNKLMKEFHRVLLLEGNDRSQNPYDVNYNKTDPYKDKRANELLCELKNADMRTITSLDAPFAANGFKSVIPGLPLLRYKTFDTCAIVASSGALANSNLGRFIDSHDLVLRFNHAPVKNHTKDVGSKTTIRIVNSQVVARRKFHFLTSRLYRNVSLLVWDPSNYTSSLYQWFRRPDFKFFANYKKFMRKKRGADFHILNPRSLWRLWNFLQDNTPYKLRKNPPSSGFLGLAMLLPHCTSVDLVEYVPSTRLSKRCHYYDPDDPSDSGAACTFGAWHPLAAEKMMAYRMRTNTDWDVFRKGVLRINGTGMLKC